MHNIIRIAARNLRRYLRRTLLTTSLITLGVVAVLLFSAITGSFKAMMIGQITDSVLGHLQIHQKGYLASIDSLPLNRNLNQTQLRKAEEVLGSLPQVAAYSPRIKLGAMFSNYQETTNIRLNAIYPDKEMQTVPLLPSRIVQGERDGLLKPGEILVPELIAKGMQVKAGDDIVLVATNRDGSVNGQSFKVRGLVEGISGPGGRDGYIHIDDAFNLLRLENMEVSEIVVRLQSLEQLPSVLAALGSSLGAMKNKMEKPVYEVHSWQELSPFFNIARMIDVMTLFIKIMLVAIVLISIMNVMVMAVYERINEIGTIAAMGTSPARILGLFLTEGFLLGLLGAAIGVAISLVLVAVLNSTGITFDFGQQKGLLLSPRLAATEVVLVSLIVMAIAIVGSWQPARRAARMDPIAALRHV